MTSNQIQNLVQKAEIIVGVKICALIAAAKISMPETNTVLRSFLQNILNNPEKADWLNTLIYYVICNNQSFKWDRYAGTNEDDEKQIIAFCETAIYKITGTNQTPTPTR